MPSGTLSPSPYLTVLDATGVAISGATVEFFASGTSAHLTAYSDAALAVPLANPATCDSAGRLVIYLQPLAYKFVIKDAGGVTIRTVDPVTSVGSAGAGLVGAALGDVFVFGGDPTSPVTTAAYPSGATFDKLHAGTSVFQLDSGSLAPGTYKLMATGLVVGVVTLSVAIVNLTDGAPDTPLATATITSTTGEVATSGTIAFAASGASKNYGVKTKITGGSGEAFGIRLVRTA